jgi:DNA-binding transcriptional MocR family regulator
VMLSARDVEEALKERLLRGAYPRGGALPSVRALAAELGTSPSTVGRPSRSWPARAGSRRPAAAKLPSHLSARARRLVKVGWALEPGGLTGWRMSAEPPRDAG